MQVIKKLGGKKYNTPNLIVITPDVKYIENIGKALLKEFKKHTGKNEKSEVQYDVRITKLWAKHITNPSEYHNILKQKHQNRKIRKVLNIYVGHPTRINKLMQDGDFKTKKLKFIVIDSRSIDKSGETTIFENTKCKSDLYEFLLLN